MWKTLIGLFFGGNPLQTIADALTKAHSDYLNSETEQQRTAAKERVDTLTAMYSDLANARAAAKSLPKWISIPGGMVAFTLGLHLTLMGVGTTLVAPFYWDASSGHYLAGDSWLEFTRHIPPLPEPLGQGELWFLGLLFGGGLIVGFLKRK